MKNFILILSFQLLASTLLFSQEFSLESPDKKNEIRIVIDKELSYSVLHKGSIILNPSPISISIDGKQLGTGARFKKQKRPIPFT